MSEHQYVAFRAIDAAISEKNLEFMRRQSSRAEITPWSFENEYNFGDFHGDALGMVCRGYDFHFHYANFGVRKLMIRLPSGLPDPKSAAEYLDGESLDFVKDKQGEGGVLLIEPFFEAGELDDLWEPARMLDQLLPLRAELFDGDLRPLYLAHLAVACDGNHDPSEQREAPVPAGLDALSDAQKAMAKLYGLSDALIAVAAKNAPRLSERGDPTAGMAQWLQRLPDATKVGWLLEMVADPSAPVRNKLLTEYQKEHPAPSWPIACPNRSIAELQATAKAFQKEMDHKRAEQGARKRERELSNMRKDPTQTLGKTEELVRQRNTQAYLRAAALLADLREALCGTDQSGLAEQQARKLKEGNPTLHHLTAELRRQDFLKK